MRSLKKAIILIAIIILIMIVLILLLKIKKQKDMEKPETPDFSDSALNPEVVNNISFKEYEIVKNCFQIYIDTLNVKNESYYGYNDNDEYTIVVSETEIKTNIFDLLSANYIKDNNISLNNVDKFVKTLDEKYLPIIVEIKKMNEPTNSVDTYYINGIIFSMQDMTKHENISLIVNIDSMNNTFSIEPIKVTTSVDKIKADPINTIEKKANNEYFETDIDEGVIVQEYFKLYKNLMLIEPEIAYNYLNKEYREAKFNGIEEFKNYIDNNKELIKKITAAEYKVSKDENGIGEEYTVHDQFDNTYIFNIESTLKYDLILDSYTIDSTQFIEKYNSTTAQGKVVLNIQKFSQAINAHDYKFAYNCLSSGFKNNYFKSIQDFKNYIENNWYNKFTVEYEEFEEDAGLYKYTISIVCFDDPDERITKTIIMKLNEGTSFELSFNV